MREYLVHVLNVRPSFNNMAISWIVGAFHFWNIRKTVGDTCRRRSIEKYFEYRWFKPQDNNKHLAFDPGIAV